MPHRSFRAPVLLALVQLSLAGSQTTTPQAQVADSGATYVPGPSWRTASPAAVGLDSSRMGKLQGDVAAGRYGATQSVLVVRFGHLVHQQYIGWDPTTPHTMQSVSKSITSLLYGILLARVGAAASLDRRVLEVFSGYQNLANPSGDKQAITVRDLLAMRDGLDFWEQPYPGSPLDSMNRSQGDWVRLILDRPMRSVPNARWSYNSGAAILTCAAIREIAGEPADDFARRELFAPIGVTGETWFVSPYDGLPHCGGGLFLKPADLARVGYLVLRHGKWGDRQVVPSSWIESATRSYSSGPALFFSNYGAQYGFFWWLFPLTRAGAGTGIIAASGSGGQWLFVVPAYDLVVAIAGTQANGLSILYDGILPALRVTNGS
jgi:CubicO group peptidase (beta-lactamase class C family)